MNADFNENWNVSMDTRASIGKFKASAVTSNRQDMSLIEPISCPCCNNFVASPSVEIVIDRYKLTPLEGRILGAVWRGKGMPVMPERIFDAMYIDDLDGGPTPTKMYQAFKVALCRLRVKIEGTGISINNVGYRQGYRLSLGGK